MKFLLFWLLALLGAFSAHSQFTLSGSITSRENNEPILATVYFPQLEKGIETDLDGNYSLESIPSGTFTIVYSALGYASLSRRISFSEESIVIENIQMSESAVEMEAVIISTPFHKLQGENVMKVERISAATLSAQGAVTLADGITDIPGVSSISTGLGIGKPVIRGLSSNRVLTYTQGVRLENQQFGDEHGLGINAAGIESVEVIKGPASLLYGSDALGGVLYLNPERFAPSGEKHIDVSSNYLSNTNGFLTNGGVQLSGNKLKFLGRIAYSVNQDYETGDDELVTNSRFNETDIKTGLRYQVSKLKSTLRYNYNRSNIGIPEEIGVQSTSTALEQPFQAIDNHILSWENNLFFNNSSLDIKLGYLFNDRREFEEKEEETTRRDETDAALQLKLNTFNYDVKYNLPELGKFETIVGIQGMHQTNENFGEEILVPDATVNDFGILATTHYHKDKFALQAGLRFDIRNLETEQAEVLQDDLFFPAISKNYSSFNAALGGKIDLSESIVARLNLASGFRAPNLAELASNGVHEGTNRFEIGNANLNNEQNFQTDLSLEYNNEHFELFVNGFYNWINDYIFITPNGDIIGDYAVYEYVQGNARLFGGEVGVHIHPHPLDWLHLESSFETVTGKQQDNSYLPLIPANVLRNTFRVELQEGKRIKQPHAFVRLASTFSQNKVSSFETKTDSYNLLSLGGGGSFDFNKLRLDIGLTVTNLTDETYIAHLSRLKIDGVPNIGRNVNVNLKLQI